MNMQMVRPCLITNHAAIPGLPLHACVHSVGLSLFCMLHRSYYKDAFQYHTVFPCSMFNSFSFPLGLFASLQL